MITNVIVDALNHCTNVAMSNFLSSIIQTQNYQIICTCIAKSDKARSANHRIKKARIDDFHRKMQIYIAGQIYFMFL